MDMVKEAATLGMRLECYTDMPGHNHEICCILAGVAWGKRLAQDPQPTPGPLAARLEEFVSSRTRTTGTTVLLPIDLARRILEALKKHGL